MDMAVGVIVGGISIGSSLMITVSPSRAEDVTFFILKIDGMMCGMCESHMNDVIRKNFKITNAVIRKLITAVIKLPKCRTGAFSPVTSVTVR